MDCPKCGWYCNWIDVGFDDFGRIKAARCDQCGWQSDDDDDECSPTNRDAVAGEGGKTDG